MKHLVLVSLTSRGEIMQRTTYDLQVLFAIELILRVGAFGIGDSKQKSWGCI